MSLLPTKKSEVLVEDPKNLIIFSTPKTGKTSALSKLDNCLIIDLEEGTKYVSGYIVTAKTYIDLYKIAKELKETEHSYKFVAIDTVTALEDSIAPELAAKLYKDTPKHTWAIYK